MITWKCPDCKRPRETGDDIVMIVCPCCMVEMEVLE